MGVITKLDVVITKLDSVISLVANSCGHWLSILVLLVLMSGVIVNLDVIINWANIIGLPRKKRTRLGFPLKGTMMNADRMSDHDGKSQTCW